MRRRQVHLDFHTSEKIDGIGPVKAKKLLSHFKTLSALKNATAEEIVRVPGISASDADSIIKYFEKDTPKGNLT